MEKKQGQFKILSIDGGGIRGIIPAMVLAEIEKRTGKRIAEMFDLIAGTSTGGILGLALSVPSEQYKDKPKYSAEELILLYQEKGSRIFHKPAFRAIKTLAGMSDELYSQKGMEEVLLEYLGDSKLTDALCEVFVTSYDIEVRQPYFFKSKKARTNADRDFFMREAARATSAAPTYFEPFKLKTNDDLRYYSLVDGGVFVNNPTMCAYAEAVNDGYDDIMIVSLGTGEMTKPIMHADAVDWGVVSWIKPLIDIMMDGNADTVAYQADQIFSERDGSDYYRIQARLIEGSEGMDNVSKTNMRMLKILGEELVAKESHKIDEICDKLLDSKPAVKAIKKHSPAAAPIERSQESVAVGRGIESAPTERGVEPKNIAHVVHNKSDDGSWG